MSETMEPMTIRELAATAQAHERTGRPPGAATKTKLSAALVSRTRAASRRSSGHSPASRTRCTIAPSSLERRASARRPRRDKPSSADTNSPPASKTCGASSRGIRQPGARIEAQNGRRVRPSTVRSAARANRDRTSRPPPEQGRRCRRSRTRAAARIPACWRMDPSLGWRGSGARGRNGMRRRHRLERLRAGAIIALAVAVGAVPANTTPRCPRIGSPRAPPPCRFQRGRSTATPPTLGGRSRALQPLGSTGNRHSASDGPKAG